jgi:hypothetical protein
MNNLEKQLKENEAYQLGREKALEVLEQTDKLDHYCECENNHLISFEVDVYDKMKEEMIRDLCIVCGEKGHDTCDNLPI